MDKEKNTSQATSNWGPIQSQDKSCFSKGEEFSWEAQMAPPSVKEKVKLRFKGIPLIIHVFQLQGMKTRAKKYGTERLQRSNWVMVSNQKLVLKK